MDHAETFGEFDSATAAVSSDQLDDDRVAETSATTDRDSEDGPEFEDVFAFVEHFLSPVTTFQLATASGQSPVWDSMWWRHTAVVARLTALWFAWEGARVSDEPSAMSSWWIHHYDPHMRMLMSETGPMSGAPDPAWAGHPRLPVASAPDHLRNYKR